MIPIIITHHWFRLLLISLSIFLISGITLPAQDRIAHRVYTFGNVADIPFDSPFSSYLETLLPMDEDYTLLITGDLVSEDASNGIDGEQRQRIESILRAATSREKGRVIIIPGDRDWDESGKDGLESVKALKEIVEEMEIPRVEWAISKGCPGPESFDLSPELALVVIDTQWWNHPYEKPKPADGKCKFITPTDFLGELDEDIADAEGKNVIIAGHYPLISLGRYGGHSKWSDHLTPPLIGSLRAAFRQNIGGRKQIGNKRFDPIREKLLDMVEDKGSLIYLSGHEKNMQVLELETNFLINSGSPTSAGYTGRDNELSRYAESTSGIMELIYHLNGVVDYHIHEFVAEKGMQLLRNDTLFVSPCDEHGQRHIVNSQFTPCIIRGGDGKGTTSAVAMTKKGGDYEAGAFMRFFLGDHYRDTWTAPVRIPFLDMENDKGGLLAYEKGGGRQTTSLKMKGGDGREYVFRSVDKTPTRVLNESLVQTLIGKALQDATSMQHPYGAMAVSKMLDATDILHASPKLYILPDDPALGAFRTKYAGMLGMLEEKPINPKNVEKGFADADEVEQSFKLLREQYNDHDNVIAVDEYTQARIFDIMVGDWGRHQDNWKWAGYDTPDGDGVVYRPVPRDRDHVFSLWDGFFPWIADREWAKKSGENFGYTIKDMRSLTWQNRHADRFWLNSVDRQEWIAAAEYIQNTVTEEVIDEAVRNMPEETLALSGLTIAEKLKQRRKDLVGYAEEYYEMLATEVDVVGSNKKEVFTAERSIDGSVLVRMYDREKGGAKGVLLYERQFLPKETKEVRLYGLGGSDDFFVSGEAEKAIRIRIIGGPGKDDVTDASEIRGPGRKTLVYENSNKGKMALGDEGKRIYNADPSLYNYDREQFAYNTYLPMISVGFNSTTGFGMGLGVRFTRQKYGKPDFSAKHTIQGKASVEDIRILSYEGRFHHVLRKWDLTVGAMIADKNDLVTFYGLGNDNLLTQDSGDNDFYAVKYKTAGLSVGLMHDFWSQCSFAAGLHYENNETAFDTTTVISEIPQLTSGISSANLAEVYSELDLDFRNRSTFADKGMRIYARHVSGVNRKADDQSYHIIEGSIENHSTFRIFSPWTLSLKAGGATSYGEKVIPFYKLVSLGQKSGLRGYQNNRFTGSSAVYFNSELRVQLAKLRSFIPLKLGLKGFMDSGRVYSESDRTDDFLTGYGFGFYIVPLTEQFAINVSYGISEEESGLILISVGTVFQ